MPTCSESKECHRERKKSSLHKIDYKLLRLQNLDKTGERFFPLFREDEMPGFSFDEFLPRGKQTEVLIDAA